MIDFESEKRHFALSFDGDGGLGESLNMIAYSKLNSKKAMILFETIMEESKSRVEFQKEDHSEIC